MTAELDTYRLTHCPKRPSEHRVTRAAELQFQYDGTDRCTSQADSGSSILVTRSRCGNGIRRPGPPFGSSGCGAGHHRATALGFAAPCWWGRRR